MGLGDKINRDNTEKTETSLLKETKPKKKGAGRPSGSANRNLKEEDKRSVSVTISTSPVLRDFYESEIEKIKDEFSLPKFSVADYFNKLLKEEKKRKSRSRKK